MANWRTFELDIGELVGHFGYEGEVTKASGDAGVDVIARKGNRVVAIQCKLYQGSVGIKPVLMLLGAQRLYGATDFILMTTGRFTKQALELGAKSDVRMIGASEILQVCREKALILRSTSFLLTPTRTVPLNQAEYLIGRDGNCQILLGDIQVSSRHARLLRNGLQLGIADLGSLNGTKINGHKIEPGPLHRLRYDDEITFANVRCKIAMHKNEVLAPPTILKL